jgi:cytochrome c
MSIVFIQPKGETMKSSILSMVATASLIISGASPAVDMPAAGLKKCRSCHTIDYTGIAPSFMDVSAKYKGDKDAVSKIAASITSGGSFGWNKGKMPARGLGANDDEIKTMAEFIAGLAK